MLSWNFLPTGKRRFHLKTSFIGEKQPCHFISHRSLSRATGRSGTGGAGWGCLFARRVSRDAISSRSPANISPPAMKQWVGDGWSKLPSAGSLAVPKPPWGRKQGVGQSSLAVLGGVSKTSPSLEFHWEGWSQSWRQTCMEE